MSSSPYHYYVVNKPYNMVSQFVSPHNVKLLSDLDFDFPENTHAVGRLDNHSEGLLILTTNKKVTRLLFQSLIPHKRTYLVQVKNKVSQENVAHLREGVFIKIEGGIQYKTPPCEVHLIEDPERIYSYNNGIKNESPSSWLLITLKEGKYHQVRKMVASIRHRCKRLIRISIEDLTLDDLAPGSIKEYEEAEFFSLLHFGELF